jgi:hypothetical protein
MNMQKSSPRLWVRAAIQDPVEEELVEDGHRVATVVLRDQYVFRGQTLSIAPDNEAFELVSLMQINPQELIAEFLHLEAVPSYTLRVRCLLVSVLGSSGRNRHLEAAQANGGVGVSYRKPDLEGLIFDPRIPLP